MQLLLTGCAGFIGAKVTELLLKAGHTVVGIDNLNDYYDVKIKEFRLNALRQLQGDWSFVQGDVEDRACLEQVFKAHTFDAIYHIAARAGVRASMETPHLYYTTNVIGGLNLLECMRQTHVRKLIAISTSSLYSGQPMPFVETSPVNEPISPYAASKKAAEMLYYTYHHLYGIDVSILRCFTVYGPNGRPDMSPDKFMRCIASGKPIQLNGDGTQSRDFTFVDDIARGIIAAQKPLGYEVINLGNHQPHTINEMIGLLEKYLNKKATIVHHPFNASDMMHTYASIEKAKQLLGWAPEIPLEQGLQKMIEGTRF